MKIQLTGRPRIDVFELEPGQAFLHDGKVYLATPMGQLANGSRFNSVGLSTGTLMNFPAGVEVDLVEGQFIEDELEVQL